MPNHVVNFVKGPVHMLQALLNSRCEVDFKQVIPPNFPYDFSGISHNHGTVNSYYDLIKNFTDNERAGFFKNLAFKQPFQESLYLDRNGNVREIPLETIYEQTFQNIKATGHPHWYSWNIENWGARTNAFDFMINLDDDDPFIVFQTAWSSPFPVFAELSRKFPGEMLSVAFADEDIGSNFGLVGFVEGGYTPLNPHIFIQERIKKLGSVFEFCVGMQITNYPILRYHDYLTVSEAYDKIGEYFFSAGQDSQEEKESIYFQTVENQAKMPMIPQNYDIP